MGGRSRKSSGSGSAGKTDAKSSMSMYNGLLGGQLGTIGETLGGLISHGQKFMEDNPAAANFIRAVGGQPMKFDAPDFIQDLKDRGAQTSPEEAARQGVSPQGPAWSYNIPGRRNFSTGLFNINDHMRNQDLGGR